MSDDVTLDEFAENGENSSNLELGPIEVDIPPQWSSGEISDLFNLISGNSYTGEHLSEEDNGGRIFLTLKSVNKGGGFNQDSIKYYTGDVNQREIVEPGELLIANTDVTQDGDVVGYSIRVPEFDSEREIAASMDLSILQPKSDDENLPYIEYLLQTGYVHSRMRAFSAGSTVLHLNTDLVESLSLPLPPLPEQRKIATVLYTIDQAIEKTERIIDQISTIKEGVQDDLITGGIGNAETTKTRLGPVSTKIPSHWDTGQIGDLFTDRQLGTDKRGSTKDGENIDLIKMGNIGFGTWDMSEVEKIEKDPQLLKEASLQRGDLLFNTRNTPELVGKTAVWEFDHEAVYDNNLLRLRFGERISSGHFVNAYFSSNIGRRQLRGRVHGTTSVAAIYWTDLQQVEIPIPPKEEQSKIVDALQELDRTQKHNKSYRNRLQRFKRGLMQDLLSGKVRTTHSNITIINDILDRELKG